MLNKENTHPQVLNKGMVKNLVEKKGRPTIFVGSSRESETIAEKIRTFFPKEEFELDVWYDGIFGNTLSTGGKYSNMEYLKNFTDIYDFAIFIFVPDDHIVSNTRMDMGDNQARRAEVTRHNVVFEYGMFLGRVGAKRSFILFDNDTRDFVDLFFTDLKENLNDGQRHIESPDDFRIEIQSYQGNYAAYRKDPSLLPYDEASISKAINHIKGRISEGFRDAVISFLPATALAFGYYNNFISIFVSNVNMLRSNAPYPKEWVKQMTTEKIDEFRHMVKRVDSIQLKIVIPTSLEGARQDQFIPHFDRQIFTEINFPGKNRSITLLQKPIAENDREWVIYDVPTTLNSSLEAIDELTKHTDIRELLKEKELQNFKKSLLKKIRNAFSIEETKNVAELISIISFDEFIEETQK